MVVDVVGASGFGIETDDHPPQTLVVMRIRSRGNRQPLAFERDSSTSGMTGHSPKGEKREFEGYGEETLTERGKEEKREPWRPAQGGGGGGGQGVPNRASFAARPCPESPPQLAATTEQLPQPRAPCGKINQRLFSLPLWARFRPEYPPRQATPRSFGWTTGRSHPTTVYDHHNHWPVTSSVFADAICFTMLMFSTLQTVTSTSCKECMR